jgi:hypothetical protein
MEIGQEKRLSAFISYAHKDEAARHLLESHLFPLRLEGLLDEWHDRLIQPGTDWENVIDKNLDRSDLVLLLVSPDFLSSQYCLGVETTRAIQLHQMGTARIVPIILRACQWEHTEFRKFQALPSGAVPVSEWSDVDVAYKDIADGIRRACSDLLGIPGNPRNPYRSASVGDWVESEGTIVIKPQNQTVLVKLRQELVQKTHDKVMVRVRATSSAGNEDKTLSIPLDKPLEDNLSMMVRQVGESLPKNAQIQIDEGGAGCEKLFIGDHVYYSTWRSKAVKVIVGAERFETTGRTWLCPDVPLDGIVKFESDNPAMHQTVVVVDHGRAHGR